MNRRDTLTALLALGATSAASLVPAQRQPPLLDIVQFDSAPDVPLIGIFPRAAIVPGRLEKPSEHAEEHPHAPARPLSLFQAA